MSFLNFKSIYAVAKKEFLDHIRSKWIIGLTFIFLILTLATSYFAGGQSNSAFGGMETTVIVLLGISPMLVPIVSIMLGYATISGESEDGSLAIVLSYPVKRIEVLLGKFFGLGSVLTTSIIIGFGIGGIVISASAGGDTWIGYMIFILLTIILGLIFLSFSIFFSSLFSKRTTSLGGGLLIYFWGMIIGMIVIGIHIGTGGDLNTFPDWLMTTMVILSPGDAIQTSIMLGFNITSFSGAGYSAEIPEYLNLGILLVIHLLWIIIPLLLAIRFFEKRDI